MSQRKASDMRWKYEMAVLTMTDVARHRHCRCGDVIVSDFIFLEAHHFERPAFFGFPDPAITTFRHHGRNPHALTPIAITCTSFSRSIMQACSNGCQLSNGKPRTASRLSAIEDGKRICRQCAAQEDALDERMLRQRKREVAMRMTSAGEVETAEGVEAAVSASAAAASEYKKNEEPPKKKKRKADHHDNNACNNHTGTSSRRVNSRIDLSLFTYPGFFWVDDIPPQARVGVEAPASTCPSEKNAGKECDKVSGACSSEKSVGTKCGMDMGESTEKSASSMEEDGKCASTKASSKAATSNTSTVRQKGLTKRMTPKREAKRDNSNGSAGDAMKAEAERTLAGRPKRTKNSDKSQHISPARSAGDIVVGEGELRAHAGKKGSLPRGVNQTSAGTFQVRIRYSGTKNGHSQIGTFDTLDQASAAYTLVRNELDKDRSLSATALDAVFEDAKARALKAAGKEVARGLPRGVREHISGRFKASAQYSGTKNTGGYIGTFGTPEQASAAYTLVRGELDKNRSRSAKELDGVFEAAKARALEAAGVRAPTGKKGGLPRGVQKAPSGRFQAGIKYSGTNNREKYIGTFDTPEQASTAYTLVRNELDKDRSLGATALDAVFEDAKARAVGAKATRKSNPGHTSPTKRITPTMASEKAGVASKEAGKLPLVGANKLEAAFARLVNEFGLTRENIQYIVKEETSINRILRPDFFDRFEFLISLGFSPSLLPSMINSANGPAFLHLTDRDRSQSVGDQYVPKYEELLRWLIYDEPESCGLGLGAGVIHNMFFTDGSGVATKRIKSIDKPMFRRFMQKIVDRNPDDVGFKFRRLWSVNSDFLEGNAAIFRLSVVVMGKGQLGFAIKEVESDKSVRVSEVTAGINKSVSMLRKDDILVPKDGTYGDRFTTIDRFREAIKDRPCHFDAIIK